MRYVNTLDMYRTYNLRSQNFRDPEDTERTLKGL